MRSDGAPFDLLTMAEVAHICHAVAGKLPGCPPIPAVRLGRRKLVRRESLIAWIENNEQPAANDNLPVSPVRGARKHA
jgi:hypothetical protein